MLDRLTEGISRFIEGRRSEEAKTEAQPEDVRAGSAVLERGQRGEYVQSVQERLHDLGYDTPQSGEFDAQTEEALKSFQADNEVTQTGQFGQTTLQYLERAESQRRSIAWTAQEAAAIGEGLGRGDTGIAVEELQGKLASLGYYTSSNGTFDAMTELGLRHFQEDREISVTGRLNEETLQVLDKEIGKEPLAHSWKGILLHLSGAENLSGHNGLGGLESFRAKAPLTPLVSGGFSSTLRSYGVAYPQLSNPSLSFGMGSTDGRFGGSVKLNGLEVSANMNLASLTGSVIPFSSLNQKIQSLPISGAKSQELTRFVETVLPEIAKNLKLQGNVKIDIGVTQDTQTPYIRINTIGAASVNLGGLELGPAVGRSWQISSQDNIPGVWSPP